MADLLTVAISALTGGLMSAIFSRAYDFSERPKLSVDYRKDHPAHFTDFDRIRPDGVDISSLFIRVRIQNSGKKVAKGVRVFLTGLEEVRDSNTFPTALYDNILLLWPGEPTKDHPSSEPRDLPRDVDFYADLVSFHKKIPNWRFCLKETYANHEKLAKHRGTYRFHVLATAENADPAQCMIDITYDGDWSKVLAVPAYRDPSDRVSIEIRI